MPIIKDQQIIDNTWTYLADDRPLVNGDITVSLKRWLDDKQQLLAHAGKVGVRFVPSDQLELSSDDLSKLKLIELSFPSFGDGRVFSQARLLRSKYGYQGEIRAVGQYLPDQVFYLSRVGVSAFEFEKSGDLQTALSALNDFSVRYQASTV